MRRCYKCRDQFEDRDLFFRVTQEDKRVRSCKDCMPVLEKEKKDVTIPREVLRDNMKIAMLRGHAQGIFSEDELRRALERMDQPANV